jgi:hypothetical protein
LGPLDEDLAERPYGYLGALLIDNADVHEESRLAGRGELFYGLIGTRMLISGAASVMP